MSSSGTSELHLNYRLVMAGRALPCSTGSATKRVVPRPASLRAQICPPCASTIAFGQEKPQPGAHRTAAQATIYAIKTLEDVWKFILRNANSLVCHKDDDTGRAILAGSLRPPPHTNNATIRRILDGIGHKISQHLAQTFLVTPDQR